MVCIVKNRSSDFILEKIRRIVETTELKEGDKLPNQNELGAQL
jgi:DNA-binding FadR family transcriptional regulator